jgi:hypothetical protein
MGAGIGLLSWLGFAIGKRRWSQSGDLSGGRASATYRRGFGRSLLLFLALGTLLGVIITVPRALGPTASTASGGGETLYDVIVYVSAYGTLAVLPFVSGLLTGSRPRPGPVLALLGGLALAIGAAIVYLVPVTILILLVTPPVPACATTYSTGCIYFGPIFDAAVLDLIGLWTAATVGVAASAAAFAGVVALGLTDGA